MYKFLQKYWSIVTLTILPLLFFYPIFFGYIPFPGDIIQKQFYPWKEYHVDNNKYWWEATAFWGSDPYIAHYPWKLIGLEMIKSGQWPLWNPYSFSGSPLLANHQSALFYPLNIIYYLVPLPIGWGIMSILQPLLGSLFFYIFIRSLKVSKYGSFFGALIYGWNSFLAGYFHIQVIGHTLIWLPLALYCLQRISVSKYKWLVVFVFSLVCILLAGHLQIASYSLLIICLFGLSRGLKTFITTIAGMVLAICLSAFQLFPTIELIQKASRDQLGLYTSFDFLLSPVSLFRFIVPRVFGHPNTENFWLKSLPVEYLYIGILGLIFSLVGIYWSVKNKGNYFWLFITLGFLILTTDSILSRFIYNLPIPFLQSVTPSRGFGVLMLPLSIFAAIGIDQFIFNFKKVQKIVILLTFLLLILLVVTYLALSYFWLDPTAVIIQSSVKFPIILIVVWTILLFVCSKRILPWGLIILLIFSFQIVDLFHEYKPLTRSFTFNKSFYPHTDLTSFLIGDGENEGNLLSSGNRFLSLDLWLLIANSFLPYHLSSVTGYDAIHLPNSLKFVEIIFETSSQKYPFDPRSIRYTIFNKNLVDILNIQYLLSLNPLNLPNINLVHKFNSVYVYENMSYLPKMFLVPNVEVLSNQLIKERITDSSRDLGEIIFLEENPMLSLEKGENDVSYSRITNGYEIKINTSTNQMLFISESFDDGWSAFVDEERTKIYKADMAFQALAVKSGAHNIKLIYQPKSFEFGLLISKITLMFMLVSFFVYLGRSKGFKFRS